MQINDTGNIQAWFRPPVGYCCLARLKDMKIIRNSICTKQFEYNRLTNLNFTALSSSHIKFLTCAELSDLLPKLSVVGTPPSCKNVKNGAKRCNCIHDWGTRILASGSINVLFGMMASWPLEGHLCSNQEV